MPGAVEQQLAVLQHAGEDGSRAGKIEGGLEQAEAVSRRFPEGQQEDGHGQDGSGFGEPGAHARKGDLQDGEDHADRQEADEKEAPLVGWQWQGAAGSEEMHGQGQQQSARKGESKPAFPWDNRRAPAAAIGRDGVARRGRAFCHFRRHTHL